MTSMSEIVEQGEREQGMIRVAPSPPPVQQVKNRYTTAMSVQKVRNLPEVDRRGMEEAAMLGESAYYAWGQGKDRVEGPTVKLAMAMVRVYGNCAVDLDEVDEKHDAWIFTARFVDLETGFTLSRQFRQSKHSVVHGKHDPERKMEIRFQIGQSKATRNVILNALPGWLADKALDRAKGGVREAIEHAIKTHGIEKVIGKALSALAALNVPEARVLATMGRKAPAALTIEDLVILQGNAAALKSGADTIDAMFPATGEPEKPEDNRPEAEKVKDDLAKQTAAAKEPEKKRRKVGIGDASAEPPEGTLLGGQ